MSVETPIVSKTARSGTERPARFAALSALGIVYGDLGTSPLYTLQTVVQAAGGHFTAESALGVLSLIFWTLIITISIKYCLFVMRADNHGEGGILALMSLVGANSLRGNAKVLTVMGLLGAALIYGDGAITPAISVLSAIEGVNVVTTALKPFVLPIGVGILLALFAAQHFGTAKIGGAFGPIMLLWFIVIAALGLMGVVRHPDVLLAVDPRHAIGFLATSGFTGLLVLGGVFLCITGGEALYADMGHFGKGPIRLSWYAIVLPALLLSYAGQTGLLMAKGTIHGNPFFLQAPSWSIYPLVVLATVATVIASQAIITGSFSMTRQAMQLGWMPGMVIRQTSADIYGQIYVPVVNWLMMLATIGITIGFGSSDRLAGAYGTAVSTTMLLTTGLLFTAMRKVWGWSTLLAVSVGGVFLIVDAGFFGANLLKIVDGGWLPLTIGALIFFIMTTWRFGVDNLKAGLDRLAGKPEAFVADLEAGRIPRVPGTAVFLTKTAAGVPPQVMEHVKYMGALQEHVLALSVIFEETPRVEDPQRCSLALLGDGVWRVTARFGFVEIPDLSEALKKIRGLDETIDLDHAIYFASRDLVIPEPSSRPALDWRVPIFAFLYRNSVRPVDRFSLPPGRVIEVARQIEV
jgi:KUP system potassium uptake protein